MSEEVVSEIVQRSMNDESFLQRFRADPEAVLESEDLKKDLSEEEIEALLSRSENSLREIIEGPVKAFVWNVKIVS